MKTFLLIDDHVVVRSGIKGLLSEMFAITEIHEAGDEYSAREKLIAYRFDLIIMDVKMLKIDTIQLMRFIHDSHPSAKVLIFSMNRENIYDKRFFTAGALGVLSKDAPLEEITKAINLVLNGDTYLSEPLARALADEALQKETSILTPTLPQVDLI